MKNALRQSLLSSTILLGTASFAMAEDSFMVHGSLSATATGTSNYDYMGNTKDTLDLNLVDIILNSTHRFDSGLRAGAQVYAYKLGKYEELTLDFANLDYPVRQEFGVRAGRNKLPNGLYNDSQDLDSIRTFASLPYSFYPKPLRAVTASFDGVSLYGNVSASKAGSIDYQVYGGAKQRIHGNDTPLLRGLSSSLIAFDNWKFNRGVYGASVFWNLPVDGLKLGYSYEYYQKTGLQGTLGTKASLRPSGAQVAGLVDSLLGQGAWDASGKFAGTPGSISDLDIAFRTLSAEYAVGKWVLTAEYQLEDLAHGITDIPALALLGMPSKGTYSARVENYYGMVSYQATDKIGLGLYYAQSYNDRTSSDAKSNPVEYNKDLCPAISYNVNKWCVVKAEYHYMKGFGVFALSGDPMPLSTSKATWDCFVLKTTVTF